MSPETCINIKYEKDKISQAYGELVSCFRLLSKDTILQPYISQQDYKRDLQNIFYPLVYIIKSIVLAL